jgi:hypothetical protein
VGIERKQVMIGTMKQIEGTESHLCSMERSLFNGVEKPRKNMAEMNISLDGLKLQYDVFREFVSDE